MVDDVELVAGLGVSSVAAYEYYGGVLDDHEAEEEEAEGGAVGLEVEHVGKGERIGLGLCDDDHLV